MKLYSSQWFRPLYEFTRIYSALGLTSKGMLTSTPPTEMWVVACWVNTCCFWKLQLLLIHWASLEPHHMLFLQTEQSKWTLYSGTTSGAMPDSQLVEITVTSLMSSELTYTSAGSGQYFCRICQCKKNKSLRKLWQNCDKAAVARYEVTLRLQWST